MSDVYRDYWTEAICQGADEAGVSLTCEQAEIIASYAQSAHDHYGYSFNDPGVGEYYDVMERKHEQRVSGINQSHEADKRDYERRIENLQYEIRRLENVIHDIRRKA